MSLTGTVTISNRSSITDLLRDEVWRDRRTRAIILTPGSQSQRRGAHRRRSHPTLAQVDILDISPAPWRHHPPGPNRPPNVLREGLRDGTGRPTESGCRCRPCWCPPPSRAQRGRLMTMPILLRASPPAATAPARTCPRARVRGRRCRPVGADQQGGSRRELAPELVVRPAAPDGCVGGTSTRGPTRDWARAALPLPLDCRATRDH